MKRWLVRYLETIQWSLTAVVAVLTVTFAGGCLGAGIYGPPDSVESCWVAGIQFVLIWIVLYLRDARIDLAKKLDQEAA